MQKNNVQSSIVLLSVLSASLPAWSTDTELERAVNDLNTQWEAANYSKKPNPPQLQQLLQQVQSLKQQYPNRAEPFALEGLVLVSLAEADSGLSSPAKLSQAIDAFERAIALNAGVLDASAPITLGALYHCLPLLLRDDDKAQNLLQQAIGLQPNAMQPNYYLGAFLLEAGQFDAAIGYLKKAHAAEVGDSIERRYLKNKSSQLLAAANKHQSPDNSPICATDFRL